MWRSLSAALMFQLTQQFLLSISQVDWCFHNDVAMQIPITGTSHALDTLTAQTEDLAALRFGGNLDACHAIQRGYFDLISQRSSAETDRISQCKSLCFTLKNRVWFVMDDHVQSTGCSAIRT